MDNLVDFYRITGKHHEAITVLQDQMRHTPETPQTHYQLFTVCFTAGDEACMAREREWLEKKQATSWLRRIELNTARASGRLRAAREGSVAEARREFAQVRGRLRQGAGRRRRGDLQHAVRHLPWPNGDRVSYPVVIGDGSATAASETVILGRWPRDNRIASIRHAVAYAFECRYPSRAV